MEYVGMIIVGLVVGALAKLFMPGNDPKGIIVTILLGLGGSFVAGFIGRAVGLYRYGYGRAPSIIASVFGAMLILAIYRVIVGRSRS